MLDNLNINKKYLGIAGFVFLLLVCYQFAFKKTVEAFQLHQSLQEKLLQSADLSYQPGYLERKNKNLDLILTKYHLDSLSLRGNTLAEISRIAAKEDVRLSEVPIEDASFHTNDFIIERLNFQGEFLSLLKVLLNLERTKCGVPRSVTVKKVKANGLNVAASKLSMEVLLEISK